MSRLVSAREAIAAQIVERNDRFPENAPGWPWSRVNKALSYVFTLPEEHLASIRLHCDLFLGENTPAQILAVPFDASHHAWLGEGIAPRLWAAETPVAVLGDPIGMEVDGRRLTGNVIVIQSYLCNLLRLGVADRDHVVEIGAGYGGLVDALMRARDIRATIIDLPETLVFSACFLLNNFPDKRAYIYTPGDDPLAIRWADFDLVFLPDYRADWLRHLPRPRFAVNTVSFPEMSRAALTRYAVLLADVLDGPLMSVNYFGAKDEQIGVPDYLARHFTLTPTPEAHMAALDVASPLYRDLHYRPTILCLPAGFDSARLIGVELREIVYHERVTTAFLENGVHIVRG